MRILVISDTHGNTRNIERAIASQPSASMVIHLGDGSDDIVDLEFAYTDKQFHAVAGNCDWNSPLPLSGELCIAGVRLFFTHGHCHGVKTDLSAIKQEARNRQAQVVLFGHTHLPVTAYDDGLYLLNPGSLQTVSGTYGVLEITEAGIALQIEQV